MGIERVPNSKRALIQAYITKRIMGQAYDRSISTRALLLFPLSRKLS